MVMIYPSIQQKHVCEWVMACVHCRPIKSLKGLCIHTRGGEEVCVCVFGDKMKGREGQPDHRARTHFPPRSPDAD